MCDSIQDLRAFSQKVYDIVEEYLNDNNIVEDEGVYVDETTTPAIINKADAIDSDRFYPIKDLLRDEDGSIEPDCDIIEEIASQYFFVR